MEALGAGQVVLCTRMMQRHAELNADGVFLGPAELHRHHLYSAFAHLSTSEPQTHRQPSADCFSIENHAVWTMHSDTVKEAIIALQVMSHMLVRSLLGWQPWQLQTACNMWTGIYCAGGKLSPSLAAAAAIVLFYQRGLP